MESMWIEDKPKLMKPEEFQEIYNSYDKNWDMKDIVFYIINSAFVAATSRIVTKSPYEGEKTYSPIYLGCAKLTVPMHILNKLVHKPEYKTKTVDEFRHKISEVIHDIIENGYVVHCAYAEYKTESDSNAYFTLYVSPFDPTDYAEEASTFAMASKAPLIQKGTVDEIESQIIENMNKSENAAE